METDTPSTFYVPVKVPAGGSGAETEFVLWKPGQILGIFLAVLSESLTITYLVSRIGWQLSGSGCLLM